jgi:hypothetical protein
LRSLNITEKNPVTSEQEATIVTAGVPGARMQPFSFAVFSVVFSTPAARLLGIVCSLRVLDEGAPSGTWPVRDFGEMTVLVQCVRKVAVRLGYGA